LCSIRYRIPVVGGRVDLSSGQHTPPREVPALIMNDVAPAADSDVRRTARSVKLWV
jgi:hypothetical protein